MLGFTPSNTLCYDESLLELELDDVFEEQFDTNEFFIDMMNECNDRINRETTHDLNNCLKAEDITTDYEEFLILYSILLGQGLSDVHHLAVGLIEISAIRESEWIMKASSTTSPKQYRTIDEHSDSQLVNLTRFNKSQLKTLLRYFFDDLDESDYIVKTNKFTYEETLLIALSKCR